MAKHRKIILWAGATLVAVSMILFWPVGAWLQCRELQGIEERVDAVYLVGGARHQQIRIDALQAYLQDRDRDDTVYLLVPRDDQKSRWNRELQENLSVHEWAAVKLQEVCDDLGFRDPRIVLLPDDVRNTDQEMEALADYIEGRSDIESVKLVSSSFHLRRCTQRLNAYLRKDIQLTVAAAASREDRMPWTVTIELCKMLRDLLGLSQCPVLSRT